MKLHSHAFSTPVASGGDMTTVVLWVALELQLKGEVKGRGGGVESTGRPRPNL